MASNVILFQQDAKLHKYTETNKDNHSCAGYKKNENIKALWYLMFLEVSSDTNQTGLIDTWF